MIRPRLIQDLRAAIDKSNYFVADDFHIDTENTKDQSSNLIVRYRFNESYYLVAVVPLSASNGPWFEISMTVKPGSIADTEVLTVGAWDQVVQATQNWLARIHEELQAVPVARDLAMQAQELEDLLRKFTDLPDEYFSKTETADMEARLEQLEARMEEGLRDQIEDLGLLKFKTIGIRQDIRTLKETLPSLKKQSWAGKLLVRVNGWMRDPDNQRVLKSGPEVARTLLLNGTPVKPRPRRSWPNWFQPQQQAVQGARPQPEVWDPPTLMGTRVKPPDTATGALPAAGD
ncbi:MAG TPA: hypothetical protein VMF70_03305 [Gemmatimonadales bacterium]|nr:hypothetical protein [Gemmatimonadales bacterium]